MVGSGPAEFVAVISLFHSALFCVLFTIHIAKAFLSAFFNLLSILPQTSKYSCVAAVSLRQAGHDREGLVLVPESVAGHRQRRKIVPWREKTLALTLDCPAQDSPTIPPSYCSSSPPPPR